MSQQPSAPETTTGIPLPHPLVVRTVALEDLAERRSAGDLLDLLPSTGSPLAWVRRGDGLVAWGETLRVQVSGPGRFADAERAWQELLTHAIVRDEVQAPGSGPVAFGSFAFDDDSPAGGVVVVPSVVVGRRGGRTWLTTITTGARLGRVPRLSDVTGPRVPPTDPGTVVYTDD